MVQSPPTVSVVVVNWNRRELLRACLESLAHQTCPNYEVIIIDNGSGDDSPSLVEEFAKAYPVPLKLTVNHENRGFCAANNQGFQLAKGEYVALLNNDAEAEPGWLEALVKACNSSDDVGMVASKVLVWEDPKRIDKCGHLIYPDGQNRGRGTGQVDRGQFDRVEEALWPDGCAALYRRAMLENIGGFDEDFFAYADDAELGLRGRIAGWRCIYTPAAVVRHHRGATLGLGSPRRLTLIERNRVLLVVKLFPLNLLWANGAYLLARIAAGLWGRAAEPGGTPSLPGIVGEVLGSASTTAGDVIGVANGTHYAPQAESLPAETQIDLRPDPQPVVTLQNPLEGTLRTFDLDPPEIDTPEPVELNAPEGSACPACGATPYVKLFRGSDRLYRTTDRLFNIVECQKCRLIRLDPQPTPFELREYYPKDYWFVPADSTADKMEQWYRRLVLRDHVHFVERALKESQEEGLVLDVGCGGGLFLQMLSERGVKRVAGLDFSLDAARAAWTRAKIPVICATLSRAPLPAGSCAAVTMFHVLEHLYDPASYLDAAHKLLKPDGRLIIQVPNAACWQFLLFGERWNGIDIPRHLINFRLSDMDELLDSCGFEVLRHKHFSLRDNPAGMATSMAPELDPMARRLRHVPETPRARLIKDLVYTTLMVACVPFTLLEAVCRAGSTVMVEARKKS